jgi:hypothetical protein
MLDPYSLIYDQYRIVDGEDRPVDQTFVQGARWLEFPGCLFQNNNLRPVVRRASNRDCVSPSKNPQLLSGKTRIGRYTFWVRWCGPVGGLSRAQSAPRPCACLPAVVVISPPS